VICLVLGAVAFFVWRSQQKSLNAMLLTETLACADLGDRRDRRGGRGRRRRQRARARQYLRAWPQQGRDRQWPVGQHRRGVPAEGHDDRHRAQGVGVLPATCT